MHLAPNTLFHRVPAELSSADATLAIPVSNGIDWVTRGGALSPGESVVVQGPGQHGLACVAAARRCGAGRVVLTGTSADRDRLDAGHALGADEVVIVDQVTDVTEAVLDALGTWADIVVDAVPMNPEPISIGIRVLAPGGRLVVAGAKRGRPAAVDTDIIFKRELSIVGVAARASRAQALALQWLAEDPTLITAFAPERLPLDQVELGLRLAAGAHAPDHYPVHVVVTP